MLILGLMLAGAAIVAVAGYCRQVARGIPNSNEDFQCF